MRPTIALVLLMAASTCLTWADEPATAQRTLAEIKKTLTGINAPGKTVKTGLDAERAAALRRLQSYRYLCGLPYEDMELDKELNDLCQAGAKLCARLGRLDHKPKNPGLPEEEYQLGFKGTSQSNLAQGLIPLARAVDGWMDDSDPGNIAVLGHRRWCLNPAMRKVGFGREKEFTAMYAFDHSRKELPNYEFISYPPAGLYPIEYFQLHHAWNVSPNPAQFEPAGKDVSPRIYRLDAKGKKAEKPLPLNYSGIDTKGFGLPNCIVFRPDKLTVLPNQRFLVVVEGVQRKGQEKTETIQFEVKFVSLK